MTADKNPLEDAVDQALDAFVYAPIGFLFDGPARFPKLVRNGKSQVNNARMLGPFAVQQARTQVGKRTADLDNPVVDLLRGLGIVPGAPTVPAATRPTPAEPAAEADDEPTAEQPAATKKAPAKKAPAKKAPAKKRAGTKRVAKKSTAKKRAPKTGAAAKASTRPATEQAAPLEDAGKPATASQRSAAEEAVEARTAAVDAATPSAAVLPIPDYDSLSASQVVSRLDGLGAGQLDAIRAYEAATRGRKTILNRVQQLSKP